MRSSNYVPKYRKHASGQARVEIDGQTFYLGKHGSPASRLAYDQLIREWLANGRRVPRCDLELGTTGLEVIAAFWEHAQEYHQGSVGRLYCIKDALRLLRQLYGRDTVSEFGPRALKTVRQAMVDAGWSRKYINDQVGTIKRVFRWAASEELVSADVVARLQTVEGLRRGKTTAAEREPVKPVADEVIERTLPHLPPVVADMVRIQRLSGTRPGEICQLRPSDIQRGGDVWTYQPQQHKTQWQGRERIVHLGPKSQKILAPYLLRAADEFCFSPRESEQRRRNLASQAGTTPAAYGNRVGSNRRRTPARKPGASYNSAAYRRAIHRGCDKAGVERWSPNRLRHTAGTDIRKNFGLEAAQVILGHATADVTQVYAERNQQLGMEVAKQVG